MVKHVQSEKGSTLVVVLLMLLIFSVIGLALLGQTLSGTLHTDMRETDMRAQYVAEKGLDYFHVYLLNHLSELEGLNSDEYNEKLIQIVEPFEEDLLVVTEQGNSFTLKVVDLSDVEESSADELLKLITVHSTGVVSKDETRPKTIETTFRIGAKQTPDALDYALGAYDICYRRNDGPCSNQGSRFKGEGNIFLHGGVSIVGDVFVENNLITKHSGIIDRQKDWVLSDYPSIEALDGGIARLVLGNTLYTLDTDVLNYHQHIDHEQFQSAHYTNRTDNVSAAFAQGYAPMLAEREPDFTPVDIVGQRDLYKYSFENQAHISNVQYVQVNNNNYIAQGTYRSVIPFRGWYNFNTDLWLAGHYHFQRLAGQNNVRITGSTSQYHRITFEEGLYVKGDLTIGSLQPSRNTSTYHKIEIVGPIYVEGDLIIQGADVRFDSAVYVEGETSISHAIIEGVIDEIDGEQVEKSLVLFGQEDVVIHNINVFKNHDESLNRLRGFFYSESLLEMYGVGSNVHIEGGIFARKIVLNATRGNVYTTGPRSGYFSVLSYYFQENQYLLPPEKSRLRIVYNPELIQNPPEGMPTVEGLEVQPLRRKIVTR